MKRSKEVVNILKEAREGKARLDEIRFLFKTRQIDYSEVQELAVEPLEKLNNGMAIISKEHGFKPKKAILASFLR